MAPPKESDIEVVSDDGGDPDSFDETLLNFETGSHECILCSGLAQVRQIFIIIVKISLCVLFFDLCFAIT